MIVNLHAQHIRDVIEDLSNQTRAEMQVLGISKDDLMPKFLRFMMSADRAEGHAWVESGRALCAMAVAEHNGRVTTFLIAGNGFFEASRHQVKLFRQYMHWMVEKFGPILCFSKSPHPETAKWMRMLGAAEVPWPNGEKVFRWG